MSDGRASRHGSTARKSSALDRAVFAIAIIVNLVLLYWPRVDTPGTGVPHLDKLAHVAAFAAVAWSGRRAGCSRRWLVPVLAVHGIVSELVQHLLLPGRAGDPADVVADVIGVAAGMLLGRRVGGNMDS